MPQIPHFHSAVFAIFEDDAGNFLLSERANTGWRDGWQTLPSGHVEPGEMPSEALAREVREEAGVGVEEASHFATVFRYRPGRTYIDFYFRVTRWSGEPTNAEPDKCGGLSWHRRDALPENTIPSVRHVLSLGPAESHFVEWQGD